jgi:putative flippase GtrA
MNGSIEMAVFRRSYSSENDAVAPGRRDNALEAGGEDGSLAPATAWNWFVPIAHHERILLWRKYYAGWTNKSARLLRFAIVGLIGAAVYTSVVWISLALLHMSALLCASLGFAAAVLSNYVLHHHWTFRSSKSHSTAFIQFSVVSVVGFTINFCFIYIGVSVLHVNYLAVQIPALGLVVTSNYVLSALWVFRVEPTKFPAS